MSKFAYCRKFTFGIPLLRLLVVVVVVVLFHPCNSKPVKATGMKLCTHCGLRDLSCKFVHVINIVSGNTGSTNDNETFTKCFTHKSDKYIHETISLYNCNFMFFLFMCY